MTDLDDLRARLLARDFLYDDPASYRGGVTAALDQVATTVADRATEDARSA
jgi:hypothetical protein